LHAAWWDCFGTKSAPFGPFLSVQSGWKEQVHQNLNQPEFVQYHIPKFILLYLLIPNGLAILFESVVI
jgi:hypothetical protein